MSANFQSRHIGPRNNDVAAMLKTVNATSIDALINETIPANIRLAKSLNLPMAMSEFEYAQHIKELGKLNKVFRSYIGLGYHGTIVPAPIQRNILENPGWYTAYTPYQAEIAQGRLEALLNFQTMVSNLTAMEIANASLLDEATAAAEAMSMFFNSRSREQVKNNANVFFVSDECLPQTIDVLKTRATPIGIELHIGNWKTFTANDTTFGAMLQYPAVNGEAHDYAQFVTAVKQHGVMVCVAADLLSLALLTPPGEWGADCVVGNTQRFGVPMGYGGPHAAFFATKDEFKRIIPGRIIGVSIDAQGKPALRMALQTREQHIRRDKATSNICTAQALLAIMAGMYAVYHGAEGIKDIATTVHLNAVTLAKALGNMGVEVTSKNYFDTITISNIDTKALRIAAEKAEINFNYVNDTTVTIALDETVLAKDIADVVAVFASVTGKTPAAVTNVEYPICANRTSAYLQHSIFNLYHSESELMRYIKRLENKDLSLTHSMISLGSCTMKLNAASELYPITMPEFANLHPFAPIAQVQGYATMIADLDTYLSEITGFDKMSFQPNSGAQGEYAGLMVIRAYHIANGDAHRNIALIPSSAHGTNPASAAMAGMKIVVTKCDELGNVDVNDLREKATLHKDNLSCLMITYPSTHGVFEESIIEITNIIHSFGGQVYMDGANMNAQVGLTSPGNIGADVCHLNLHKTFAIPHGGGGPGMGPIGVKKHLTPFLPSHPVIAINGTQAIHAVSAAQYGSALILLISYGYIKMLGAQGVTDSTRYAILNANYMKERLAPHYKILYTNVNGRCAHEMILDCRSFKSIAGVDVTDVAKRLMDYGFHAPTVSFPVAETLMIEPTESESKEELDRFCDAMISIKQELDEVINGTAHATDNVLKNAPHTASVLTADVWEHTYSRTKAAFPLAHIATAKFWPSVSRIDAAHGDRNLICTCPEISEYEGVEV
ncbi:MAG: aminomethyl-transferring glycine dehydrogenase [Bacteroidia bacterium]